MVLFQEVKRTKNMKARDAEEKNDVRFLAAAEWPDTGSQSQNKHTPDLLETTQVVIKGCSLPFA